MKKIAIIGGGTFAPIRNHLALCAPAFGTTADNLGLLIDEVSRELKMGQQDVRIHKTAMAGGHREFRTNEDVSGLLDELISDENVGTIILNVAFCDFEPIDELAGFHGPRLKTSLGNRILHIRPSDKIIDKIRRVRPDIFLVGFKTTTNASTNEQFLSGLKMMKRSKCNLVLANDTVTRQNMIITPEESKYCITEDRNKVLTELVNMTLLRNNLTYTRTNFILQENIPLNRLPKSFTKVLQYLVDNGGFIENNGNGFTPGHFGVCNGSLKHVFYSSQRKVNHNDVFKNGMTMVGVRKSGRIDAYGSHKPSVGARSQKLLFDEYPDYDCIVHIHTPLKDGHHDIGWAAQRPFQCGSLECGMNTLQGMTDIEDGIKAVFLEKHGPNILFKSSIDPQKVIDFIDNNFKLGTKIH